MTEKKPKRSFFTLYKTAISSLFAHKEIFFPFVIAAFIKFLFLEIIYFFPRAPWSNMFGFIISKLWGPDSMHFPHNFLLLQHFFVKVEAPFYLLIDSYLIGVGVYIVHKINNEEVLNIKQIFREVLSYYLYIVAAAALTFFLIKGWFFVAKLAYARAELIRSTAGPFFWLKATIIYGYQYYNLLANVLFTTLFVYVLPVVVLEKISILKAIRLNFKMVFKYFWITFFTVFTTTLIYLFVIWFRNIYSHGILDPGTIIWVLIAQICVTQFIYAIVYTAVATYYLLDKEGAL